MKTYPARSPRKIAIMLVSLLLFVAVVLLSVFITHKPRALWSIKESYRIASAKYAGSVLADEKSTASTPTEKNRSNQTLCLFILLTSASLYR